MNDEQKRWQVGVDFDGVLHQYVAPWIDAETIPDPPVDGAADWFREVMVEYVVVVQTTRGASHGGRSAVRDWLYEHGILLTDDAITWDPLADRLEGRADGVLVAVVTDRKLPCLLYIDDRAWRFYGRFPSLKAIRYAKPWRTGDPARVTTGDRLRKLGSEQNRLQGKIGRVKAERDKAVTRGDELHLALHDALDLGDGERCDWCP